MESDKNEVVGGWAIFCKKVNPSMCIMSKDSFQNKAMKNSSGLPWSRAWSLGLNYRV